MTFELVGGTTVDDIHDCANQNGVEQHVAAIMLGSPLSKRPDIWPELKEIKEAARVSDIDLVGEFDDVISELSRQINGYLQFPQSTIFLHGLGCVSMAMCKSFKVGTDEYNMPALLYVITAQPPSTGKSEVNKKFYLPIVKAIDEHNKRTMPQRERLSREVRRLKTKIEANEKRCDSKDEEVNWHDVEEDLRRLQEKEDQLKKMPKWNHAFTNATQESIEESLADNDGMFSIISAEADAINVAVGATYGDGKSKVNNDLFLKAWDGDEPYNSSRVSRGGYQGIARGAISIIAQDDTIDTMMNAGASGRGLTERFLMLSEKSMLGERDHEKPYRFDRNVYDIYCQLIKNIIDEDEIVLRISDEAAESLRAYKTMMEPTIGESGQNSDNLITGFIGKADKHIKRIAAILHTVEQWQDGGERKRDISDDTMVRARGIFDALAKCFINSADVLGYSGNKSKLLYITNYISNQAVRGVLKITLTQLFDGIKKGKPFATERNLKVRIKREVIPELQKLGYCHFDGSHVYINPRLK